MGTRKISSSLESYHAMDVGGAYMDHLASVVQAIPREDHTVYAYFNDGSVRRADIKPIIAKGGIFARLADE